jgi:hypothetical protein
MKRDTLNVSKGHASVIKITLLTMLLAGCMSSLADDSRTPMTRLNKLALAKGNSLEQANLQILSGRFDKLFSDFFDINNTMSYTLHKARFFCLLNDLNSFLTTAKIDKPTHKEITSMIKEVHAFIATLDNKAQPIIKKGKAATYTDIMPLALPLQPFKHLIPDIYLKSLMGFLSSIRHRLSCS